MQVVRSVRFGIGVKFGLFVALVLAAVMFVTGLFIVREQQNLLERQLKRDLSSHLQAYRIASAASLGETEDVRRLQAYTYALSNVNNFEKAMFVDPRGRVFAQVDRAGVPFDGRAAMFAMELPKLADAELAARYPDIGYLLSDMSDETNVVFVRSSRYTVAEYRDLCAKAATNGILAGPNNSWFEGFLPVCVNWLKQLDPADDSLATALRLYRERASRGFAFSGEQSAGRKRDLAFCGQVEAVARWLVSENLDPYGRRTGWELTSFARVLAVRERDRISEAESWQLAQMIPLCEQYRRGEAATNPAALFTREVLDRTVTLVERFYAGTTLPEGLAGLLGDARAGKLFAMAAAADDVTEIAVARDWLRVADAVTRSSGPAWNKLYGEIVGERLVRPFLYGDEIFIDIGLFRSLFDSYLKTGSFPVPDTHRYQKLGRVYAPKKSVEEHAAFVRHMMRILVTPFKFGYVRVILDPQSIRGEVVGVASRTTDIAVALVIRAVLVSLLLAGFLVRNIRKLSEGASRVGQGDLESHISVRSHDELGRLADQFNLMIDEIRRSQAELVEKSRMQEELRIAETIQQRLLPATFPDVPGYRFGAYYSAQTEAGGDYYDVLGEAVVGPGLVGMVSADVSGHGVGAGLVMTMARALLHAHAVGLRDPGAVLARVNPQLFRDTPPAIFVTAFYATLDTATHSFEYSSAGHNPALCARAGGDVEKLATGGIPLGMADAATFDRIIATGRTTLAVGDVVLLYTDGVTEAMNGDREEYGEERLIAALARNASLEPERLIEALNADLAAFTGDLPQEDDISMLVVRRARG